MNIFFYGNDCIKPEMQLHLLQLHDATGLSRYEGQSFPQYSNDAIEKDEIIKKISERQNL